MIVRDITLLWAPSASPLETVFVCERMLPGVGGAIDHEISGAIDGLKCTAQLPHLGQVRG